LRSSRPLCTTTAPGLRSCSRPSTLRTRTTPSSCEYHAPLVYLGTTYPARLTLTRRTPHQGILPATASEHVALARLAQLPPLRLNIDANTAAPAASSTYPPFLPGAGLTRRLLGALADVPSGAIAAWVVEGDNRGDATALATVALAVLQLGG
jgi:hypothetical protein